jgi:hypothetical protein
MELTVGKATQKFSNFHKTAQSKQPKNRLEFAQSGHPGTKTIVSLISMYVMLHHM